MREQVRIKNSASIMTQRDGNETSGEGRQLNIRKTGFSTHFRFLWNTWRFDLGRGLPRRGSFGVCSVFSCRGGVRERLKAPESCGGADVSRSIPKLALPSKSTIDSQSDSLLWRDGRALSTMI